MRPEDVRAAVRRERQTVPKTEDSAAVAVVLVGRPMQVLLIRRASSKRDPWSGHMAFPGGKHERRDASLLQTAIRETYEEVGLQLAESHCMGWMDDVYAGVSRPSPSLRIRPFFFHLPQFDLSSSPFALNREVDEVVWADLRQMRDGELDGVRPWSDGKRTYQMPAYDVRGRIVWGLTYKMLRQLFTAMEKTG